MAFTVYIDPHETDFTVGLLPNVAVPWAECSKVYIAFG